MSHVLKQMEILRNLVSLHNKARQKNGKPLSEYILDIAYGGANPEDYYLDTEHRTELAKACEVFDQGYDLSDLNTYEHYNNLAEPPTDPKWTCVSDNGLYFCYDNRTPNWLETENQKRRDHRAEMQRRKDDENVV